MRAICPSTEIFNQNLLYKFKKYFRCNFRKMSQSKFSSLVHNYEIVIVRFNKFLPFKKNHKIRFILSPTTGEDHIDAKFFLDKKVKIFTLKNKQKFLKDVNASSEFTITLILMTLRKIKENLRFKKNVIGNEIAKKKIGIIGLGRNGKKIAKILLKFSAKLSYFDKQKVKSKNNKIKFLSLNNLLATNDLIIICIPLNKNNYNFLNKSKIKLIKQNSIIVNTSRGKVLDEGFIISLAKKRKIFYSSDVLSNEFSNNYDKRIDNLNKFSNILITNHIGGLTEESILKTDELIFNNFFKTLGLN